MTDEEKKAAEAEAEAEAKKAEKEAADAEFEATLDGLSDEEKEAKRAERDASNPDNKIDYKAQAQKEREAREKAEQAIAKAKADAARRRKGKDDDAGDDDEDDEDDEDKPLTKRELEALLEENSQKTEKRLMAGQIRKCAEDLAESPDEADYIIEIHKNRTFPSHLSIEDQVREAHAIANAPRLRSKNKELARALQGKDSASKDSASSYRDPMSGNAPRQSSADQAAYKRAGFSFDTTSKLWTKKLPNGKTLVKDPKTGKVSIRN